MQKRNLKNKIIKTLQKNHLMSAVDILDFLEKQDHPYNKTSVYRALDQLLENGLICQHHFNDSQAVYELREDHHTHLVCNKCDKISMMECDYEHKTKVGDFMIDHHHLTLAGVCGDCV